MPEKLYVIYETTGPVGEKLYAAMSVDDLENTYPFLPQSDAAVALGLGESATHEEVERAMTDAGVKFEIRGGEPKPKSPTKYGRLGGNGTVNGGYERFAEERR